MVEALEGVDRQLEAHQAALAQGVDLRGEAALLAERKQQGSHLAGLTPDLDTYDGLLDERDGLDQQLDAATLVEQVAGDKLSLAKADVDERAAAVNLARQAVENNGDPTRTLALRRDLRLKELALRRAAAEAARRQVERDNTAADRANAEAQLALVLESIDTVVVALVVDADAIDARIAALEGRRAELEMLRGSAEFDKNIAEAKAKNLSERSDEGGEDPLMAERILGLKRDLERQEQRLAFLDAENQRIDADIEAWKRRDDVLSAGLGAEKLAELRSLEQSYVTLARTDISVLGKVLATLRTKQDGVRQALEAAVEPDMQAALRLRQSALVAHVALVEQEIGRIQSSLKLHQRLLDEIESKIRASPLAEAWAHTREALRGVWGFSLYTVTSADGTRYPVTFGKVVNALLVFVVGLILARMLARWLAARVFPRFHLDAAASATYRTLVFYFLLLTVFLSVLRIMDIPLTAFTVLGGALAIGVGFGSQNLVNNFISGLILMAERPIRIGDLIEVDGTYGIVESIGARSTTVLTSDNTNMVIPNSSFLENNVVNWTLSNDVIRTKVAVGVAYGSPTRDVDRLLYRAVEEHGKILKMPAPQVIFEDFGDNALIFDVYFWIRARTVMERRRVQSDVRFRIDNLFREAGITIAFPQRDVHLDGLSPLEVRMLPPEDDDGDEAPAVSRRGAVPPS